MGCSPADIADLSDVTIVIREVSADASEVVERLHNTLHHAALHQDSLTPLMYASAATHAVLLCAARYDLDNAPDWAIRE